MQPETKFQGPEFEPWQRDAVPGSHQLASEILLRLRPPKKESDMMPITARVQNQAEGNTVQPRSKSSVKAGAVRLRRRLSKIFHLESEESGFFSWRESGPGTPGINHCSNLPIPANPTVPAADVCAIPGGIFFI